MFAKQTSFSDFFLLCPTSPEPIWKVARYTSAAPMFFSEFENYVDGGVLANNPSDAGLTRIQRYYRECSQKLPIACVVSLGSGMYPAVELGNIGKYMQDGSYRLVVLAMSLTFPSTTLVSYVIGGVISWLQTYSP